MRAFIRRPRTRGRPPPARRSGCAGTPGAAGSSERGATDRRWPATPGRCARASRSPAAARDRPDAGRRCLGGALSVSLRRSLKSALIRCVDAPWRMKYVSSALASLTRATARSPALRAAPSKVDADGQAAHRGEATEIDGRELPKVGQLLHLDAGRVEFVLRGVGQAHRDVVEEDEPHLGVLQREHHAALRGRSRLAPAPGCRRRPPIAWRKPAAPRTPLPTGRRDQPAIAGTPAPPRSTAPHSARAGRGAPRAGTRRDGAQGPPSPSVSVAMRKPAGTAVPAGRRRRCRRRPQSAWHASAVRLPPCRRRRRRSRPPASTGPPGTRARPSTSVPNVATRLGFAEVMSQATSQASQVAATLNVPVCGYCCAMRRKTVRTPARRGRLRRSSSAPGRSASARSAAAALS